MSQAMGLSVQASIKENGWPINIAMLKFLFVLFIEMMTLRKPTRAWTRERKVRRERLRSHAMS